MIDPRERLREARIATSEGRFDDALQGLVWFHENALAIEPSLAGVRLSFALSAWVELGARYPEALRVLAGMRDATAAELLAGVPTVDAPIAAREQFRRFFDVAAIDEVLGAPQRTSELFASLADLDPPFAASCFHVALRNVVAAGDFVLAARFLGHARQLVAFQAEMANVCAREGDVSTSGHFAAYVADIVTALAGVGRVAEADEMRGFAVECLENEAARQNVRDDLSRSRPDGVPGDGAAP